MSQINSNEVLRPILLRSATPASNEKVLDYLEGMQRDEVDNTPPGSILDHEEYKSRMSEASLRSGIASPVPKRSVSELQDLANSPVSYDKAVPPVPMTTTIEEDAATDVDSNEQQKSESGLLMTPAHEPGPHDPPGPHYESYDSGPSFGNFGPLPTDDAPFIMSTWMPNYNITKDQPTFPMGPGYGYDGGVMQVPLSDSALATPKGSINQLDSPSSPQSRNFQGAPRSHKASSAVSDARTKQPTSPKSMKAPPTNVAPLSPPLSPKSHVTSKSAAKSRTGTAYPPLPESQFGGDNLLNFSSPVSPTRSTRAPTTRSKAAPSIAPSESPSQTKVQQSSAAKSPSRKAPSLVNKSEAEILSPRSGTARQVPASNPSRSPPPTSRSPPHGSVMSGGHQSRPFSPYRHAPTQEDLLHAATRGRALHIPDPEPSVKAPSVAAGPSSPVSPRSKKSEVRSNGKVPSVASTAKPQSVASAKSHKSQANGGDRTPTQARSPSPEELNQEEDKIVRETLALQTPRSSLYSPSTLDSETANAFHDMELCHLLHHLDSDAPEVVKKAVKKAVKQRIKKLGMKHDNETIRQIAKNHRNHDPSVHAPSEYATGDEPPRWAADIKREIVLMQQRIESLGPKIENLRGASPNASFQVGPGEASGYYNGDEFGQTPVTQTVNIQAQPEGTLADSMYQPPQTEVVVEDSESRMHEEQEFDNIPETPRRPFDSFSQNDRDDSPGKLLLEQELYKLRETKGSQSGLSHRTWEVSRTDQGVEYEEVDDQGGAPTIPDGEAEYPEGRPSSPPLPPVPVEETTTPWQKIHGRLLSWAIVWPMSDLDTALNSTTRGHQVNEVALSIWSTQTYKRYVRSRLTDSPQGVVDRMFVPPHMADAINTAVFNGRHGEACGILRDLWSPFGLEGMPRLLVVLAKHRTDENHWVVHRFSLPDGALTTYDSYPERTLPDGRPLGWWFSIRLAWPNAIYPSPDHLMQKMVRLHRPMQLPIDNSVAAAGIWRNILMGSRAERSLDLERLRDLINTEVKNLRQRKHLGKLSISAPRPAWDDMS